MGKIPENCPSCQGQLTITQLTCSNCGLEVNGQFDPNIFSRLSADDLNFIVMFVRSKGNIKEMEREIGISYWTIRRKLDEVVERLALIGETPKREDRTTRRVSILQRLRSGELTVEEASAMLEEIKRER